MGQRMNQLDESGRTNCIDCGEITFISDLAECVFCGCWVCKKCATYRRQGTPFGYVCKRCKSKM